MFRSSHLYMLVSVVVVGLLSLSTEAVAGQPACTSPACLPTPSIAATTPTPATLATLATPMSLQQTRDAIGAVAEQMGQVTRDTSLTQDARVQHINDLAVQFDRLVNQLQQLDCGQACPPAPAATPPATLAALPSAQQTKDRIVGLGQQLGQVALDSALSQDAKVQQINALALEVNQLGSQLQRSDCGTACARSNPSAADPSTPAPPAAPATPVSGEQTRAEIAAVAQQVGQVMQDGTLSPDARAQQINALATQFNQLVSQLQQLPQAP